MKRLIRIAERWRILHIAYWAWAFAGLYHERIQHGGRSIVPPLTMSALLVAGEMLSVYLSLYLIIPRTFRKGRYGLFVLLTLLACLLGGMTSTGLSALAVWIRTGDPMRHLLMWTLSNTVESFIATAVFVAVSMAYSHYRQDRRTKRLEREQLETELSVLRAQINPHFLFNAINSIYVLIDLDPQQAGETLLRFSGLLRYHLYECREELVALDRELQFLQDYIKLESQRKGARIRVRSLLPEHPEAFRIAPFLLLPFVENAFKFVSTGKARDNTIDIRAFITGSTFRFAISNTMDEPAPQSPGSGGIGLANVRRRLALLYPGRHTLHIAAEGGIHEINLELHVRTDELPDRRG